MPAVVWFGFLWGVSFNDETHLAAAAGLLRWGGERQGEGWEAVGLTPHDSK